MRSGEGEQFGSVWLDLKVSEKSGRKRLGHVIESLVFTLPQGGDSEKGSEQMRLWVGVWGRGWRGGSGSRR